MHVTFTCINFWQQLNFTEEVEKEKEDCRVVKQKTPLLLLFNLYLLQFQFQFKSVAHPHQPLQFCATRQPNHLQLMGQESTLKAGRAYLCCLQELTFQQGMVDFHSPKKLTLLKPRVNFQGLLFKF